MRWPIAPPVRPTPLTQDGLLGLFSRRNDRGGFRADPGDRRRHARQERGAEEIAGSGVRQCLIWKPWPGLEAALQRAGSPEGSREVTEAFAYDIAGRMRPMTSGDAVRRCAVAAAATAWAAMPGGRDGGRGAGGGQLRDPGPVTPRTIRKGPHDKPQSHVPGLRVVARGSADAAGGDGAVGIGLLRLWPDLRSPLLRRAAVGRLCAVQFAKRW